MSYGSAERLRPRRVPPSARRNFRFELTSVAFMAAGLACVDVNVLGVIARKAFNANAWVITFISACDAIAHVTSLLWTRLLHATDRVRSANMLQYATIFCVAGIALAPYNWLGIGLLAALALAARVFFTGIVNARTDLWRSNYPRNIRGMLIARLTIVGTFVIAATAAAVALAMDLPPAFLSRLGLGAIEGHTFRPVYFVAAFTACIGARAFARVRWRGRAAQMKTERAARGAGGGHAAGPAAMLSILRTDREYRRYMAAQFVLGAPNLAAGPIFIIALDPFSLDYTQSMALVRIIPILVPVLATPLWGRLLDRMHIVRFRSYHSWVFVAANALMAAGLLLHSLPVLYASRILLGVAFAGGLLAWELGHHDFARREQASAYMGVHVTLTGVRGVFAPFLGTLLYKPMDLSFISPGLRYPGMGAWTFALLAAVSAAGAVMFVRLYLDTRHRTRARPAHD